MKAFRIAGLTLLASFMTLSALASVPGADPLAAIDMNRNAIIADIVQGFDGDRAALAKRLAGLRADRLLSASLASTPASLESILGEAEKSRDAALIRTGAKALGSANADLVYTPITPCRLVDTRGGAPIAGGPFAPNERRSYAPNGLCSLPLTGVASMLVSFTTLNNTPNSGGYLAIVGPAAPVTTTADIFNLGTAWSAANTAVATGPAAQFDVFVSTASPEVVIDILGYFAPPQGGFVTSVTAGAGLTGGTITSSGTIDIATGFQLPQSCTNGQVAQSNGSGAWTCVTPPASSGGTVTSVGSGTGLTGGPITTSGTVALAPAYQLPQACANGQVVQSNGAGAWSCVTPPTPTGGTVTAVTASAPLASSGGATPDISLTGTVGVANGGTGQATLASNGIVYGQGTAAVATTAAGASGEVLVGTAGPPAWTASPFLSGNLLLVNSTSTAGGTIFKNGVPFIHNFGTNNTFIGSNAGNFVMTGAANTGIGLSALASNATGGSNTATGHLALVSNESGSSNTATGRSALINNTSGFQNTAMGAGALSLNNNTGYNVAVGADALSQNIGSANTAIGTFALSGNSTGNFNIAVGYLAGNFHIGNNNIAIGSAGENGDEAAIRIGDPNTHIRAFIGGIRGVTTGEGDAVAVFVDSLGQLGTISSSRRFKDDIADMDAATSALMKLRPVTFHYKTDRSPSARTQYGLIAEEVEQVYPGLVAHSADGQAETVMYQYLPSMLLNEYQKQQRVIESQTARIDAQAREIAELRSLMVRALERNAPFNVVRQ